MAMPHADNAPGRTSRSPDEHNQPRIKPSNRYESWLSIVEAVILAGEVNTGQDLLGPAHVETTRLQRVLPLRAVTGNAHF